VWHYVCCPSRTWNTNGYGAAMKWYLDAKTKHSQNIRPRAILSTTNQTWTDLDANQRPCSRKSPEVWHCISCCVCYSTCFVLCLFLRCSLFSRSYAISRNLFSVCIWLVVCPEKVQRHFCAATSLSVLLSMCNQHSNIVTLKLFLIRSKRLIPFVNIAIITPFTLALIYNFVSI
jgi:hypothetical protein